MQGHAVCWAAAPCCALAAGCGGVLCTACIMRFRFHKAKEPGAWNSKLGVWLSQALWSQYRKQVLGP